jgi:MFS family permease
MSVSSSVNVTELIDRSPVGPLQIRIIVLCGLVALLDGFDLGTIGVAAPAMAGPLHIASNQFGAVFSASVLGLMLGGFVLGPIADRYGRRCVLIAAIATLGVFTLCTASATTLQQVLLFRFLTGVGLGGAMPSFISLAAEYTPRSSRQAVVGLLCINDEKTRGVAVRQLFSAGRARGTILLWASYFVTFMVLVTSAAWTPTLLQRTGINGVQSSIAMALFALGAWPERRSPGFCWVASLLDAFCQPLWLAAP